VIIPALNEAENIVHCLAFRPEKIIGGEPSRFLCASGSEDKTVRVWQPAVGRMVRIVRGHDGPIFAAAYSMDGARLYSAGKEGIVRAIDADSDQVLHSWAAHDDWILDCNKSDGQLCTGVERNSETFGTRGSSCRTPEEIR
jgi:WD40 repeat protein